MAGISGGRRPSPGPGGTGQRWWPIGGCPAGVRGATGNTKAHGRLEGVGSRAGRTVERARHRDRATGNMRAAARPGRRRSERGRFADPRRRRNRRVTRMRPALPPSRRTVESLSRCGAGAESGAECAVGSVGRARSGGGRLVGSGTRRRRAGGRRPVPRHRCAVGRPPRAGGRNAPGHGGRLARQGRHGGLPGTRRAVVRASHGAGTLRGHGPARTAGSRRRTLGTGGRRDPRRLGVLVGGGVGGHGGLFS
ncbi:hypothetical protein SXIM_01360 [Streptomyces xiamenensis]|uniref:Uncharacterized protein n=1 Tax=Streptomyces xiamenensis TaxID=408015 RepID=A0A0F7FNK5_9ACTN|nr:hypothetical protein SXIM_01360 [Streptomyces xiamenensis]